MLPVFERFHGLLWYPVQFEGNECSPNIMYSGAQPQILPALQSRMANSFERGAANAGEEYVAERHGN